MHLLKHLPTTYLDLFQVNARALVHVPDKSAHEQYNFFYTKSNLTLKDAIITDLFPERTEYVDGSLNVKNYPESINGTPTGNEVEVSGIEPSSDRNELTIPLGDISEFIKGMTLTDI